MTNKPARVGMWVYIYMRRSVRRLFKRHFKKKRKKRILSYATKDSHESRNLKML